MGVFDSDLSSKSRFSVQTGQRPATTLESGFPIPLYYFLNKYKPLYSSDPEPGHGAVDFSLTSSSGITKKRPAFRDPGMGARHGGQGAVRYLTFILPFMKIPQGCPRKNQGEN
jgi:hypothetical protein